MLPAFDMWPNYWRSADLGQASDVLAMSRTAASPTHLTHGNYRERWFVQDGLLKVRAASHAIAQRCDISHIAPR